jgi:hypothetical protein
MVTNLTIALIDEFTAVIALLLTISSVFSFFSIRTPDPEKYQLESIADKFFVVSFGIFCNNYFITITYWGK